MMELPSRWCEGIDGKFVLVVCGNLVLVGRLVEGFELLLLLRDLLLRFERRIGILMSSGSFVVCF